MAWTAWGSGSGRAIARNWSRRRVFEAARAAADGGQRGVTVYDGDGHVFNAQGRPAACPECGRGSGEHFDGPPHCSRSVH